ncbi:MAG: hypothetical protein LBU60_03980 [Clostridiales bacterium]|jgi:predicted ATP-dependent serine protease|nr:hypothetical protein [Clostridiales bacterium]
MKKSKCKRCNNSGYFEKEWKGLCEDCLQHKVDDELDANLIAQDFIKNELNLSWED